MTVANLLIRLRTIIDEASASYFTDAECYNALTDGQKEVINLIVSIYEAKLKINPKEEIPELLFPIIKTTSGTVANGGTSITIPADYLKDLWLQYSHDIVTVIGLKPCVKRQYGRGYPQLLSNSYMKDVLGSEYHYSIYGTIILLETAATVNTGNYKFSYISIPTDIVAGGTVTLPENAMEALVHYAAADLFTKDELIEQANLEFQKFLQLTKNLYL